MTAAITSSVDRSAGSRLVVSLFVGGMVAYGLYAAVISAPAMRAAAKEQLDRAIAEENGTFCEKFGMRAGTSEFAVCSQELAIIRQKQADRDSGAAFL
jgi:hypothetical protein